VKKLLLNWLLISAIGATAGTINTSVTSLSGFGNVYVFHSSTSLRYTVSASALTAPLIITAPTGFEISLNYLHSYTHSIQLNPVSGNISTTNIYVRFSPSTLGAASGSVSNSSLGSTTKNVSVTGTCINWNIPPNYYNTINTQRNAALKTALFSIVSSGTTALSYTPGVWNAFATTDVQPNGKVWDIYSTRFDQASPYEFTLGTDQDAGSGGTAEGQKYNREHSFPQSWFGGSVTPMHSDLHHVFATDKFVNAQRADFPYGTVSAPNWTSLIGGKRGPNTFPGYTGTVFEPIDEYKGDVARAQLYMATRYENLIAGWQTNATADNVLSGNSFPAYDAWFVNLLISWHNLDPVSDKEIKRNSAIHALQNNRNPFIDSPQFVQRIWGGSIPAEPTLQASNLQVTNNSTSSVTLKWVSGNGQRRLVLIRQGSPIGQLPVDTVRYTANANLPNATLLGNGTYAVYNGTGSTVTITGMQPNVQYHYAVIEYNGWYTTSNYNTTGYLTSSSTTLPVSWLGISANQTDDGDVLIKWATASEYNNDYFDVQRSIDAIHYETIATIKGNSNTSSRSDYKYIDVSAVVGQSSYYRIKQVDFDGSHSFSEIATVIVRSNSFDALLYPNPAKDFIAIVPRFNQVGNYEVVIQNQHGITVVNQIVENEKDVHHMDVCHLALGMYFITIRHESTRQTWRTKFIKQ
jgi:endonuclease I